MAIYKEVIHFRRIKTMAGSIQVMKHNTRDKNNLESFIDSEKSEFNRYGGATTPETFQVIYQEMIDTAKLKRKIQKNASRIIEFVISMSHEYCESWEKNKDKKSKIDSYFQDTKDFLKGKYGDVIISSAIHYDEKTPHLHVMCIPLVQKKGSTEKKFSSSEFIGGIKELQNLHTEFHQQVGQKYGLERGNQGSRTTHSDLKQYKIKEDAKIQFLDHEQQIFNNRFKKQDARENELNDRETELSKREEYFSTLEQDAKKQTPIIPIPPFMMKEKERKSWRDTIQEKITEAFKGIILKYESLTKRFNNLVDRYNSLNKTFSEWKSRAENAERDLQQKPLQEIQAERERKANSQQSEQQQKRNRSR
jgi:hypothetical protein